MKRYGWLMVLLALLLLTGWALAWAPCLHRSARPHGRRHASRSSTILAAWQYTHSYGRHWRDCLLQR